jgi:tetratricopeptide (TPR) repeat protein
MTRLLTLTAGLLLSLAAAQTAPTTPIPTPTTAPTTAPVQPGPGQTVTTTGGSLKDLPIPATPAEAPALYQQAQTLAQQARAAYPKGSWSIDQSLWKQAATAADRAAQAVPGNLDYLRLRATIYSDTGFWRQAELGWAAVLALAPADPQATASAATAAYNLGYAAYSRGDSTTATQAFGRCLSLTPGDARCLSWAGRLALEGGDYSRAVSYYTQAATANPQDKANSYFVGVAQSAGKYGPAATRAFSRAYAEAAAGRRAAALPLYREAVAAAPNFLEAQRELGRLALEASDAATAVTAYSAAAGLPAASASDRYNLALAQEGAQYGLKAVQTFRAAYARYTAGDRAGAASGFQAASEASPNYQKAWAWLGRVRYEARDYAGAVTAYEAAVRLDPNDRAAANFLRLARAGR